MTVKEFIDEWQSPQDYIIAHTSGSTGSPKPIKLSKKMVEASARRSINHFGLNASSHLHLCLSPDYIAGKMVIVRALICGANLTWEDPSSTPLKHSSLSEITLLSAVGAQLPGMLQTYRSGTLPRIRHLLIGGAPLTKATAESALQIAENLWESYGMTETASHIALRRISSITDLETTPFTPLPGITIGKDPRNCLTIQLPDEPAIITNDIAQIDPNQEFRILGRHDNVIITGAKKVYPEQIEKKLQEILQPYKTWYITSQPDEKWGRTIVLKIESKPLTSRQEQELKAALAQRLPPEERPRKIITETQIPRTSTGKIKR